MTPDLFTYEPPAAPEHAPYARGSDTSKAAAESIEPSVNALRRKVLDFVKRAPSTCDEIEVGTGLSHQTASARCRELVQLGLVEDTGERRETRSGRKARVLRARAA